MKAAAGQTQKSRLDPVPKGTDRAAPLPRKIRYRASPHACPFLGTGNESPEVNSRMGSIAQASDLPGTYAI